VTEEAISTVHAIAVQEAEPKAKTDWLSTHTYLVSIAELERCISLFIRYICYIFRYIVYV
jgi:hypothetical protein